MLNKKEVINLGIILILILNMIFFVSPKVSSEKESEILTINGIKYDSKIDEYFNDPVLVERIIAKQGLDSYFLEIENNIIWVDVIIDIKDLSDITISSKDSMEIQIEKDKQRSEFFNNVTESILATFSEEEFRYKDKMDRTIFGYVTQEGFNKLLSNPNVKSKGAWERPISIFRCGFSYICQARGWLPDPIGGLVWFGPDQPMSTCYVPFYAGVTNIAEPYYTCDTTTFSLKSAWWAFNFVANWAGLKYSYIIKDIKQKQDEIEIAEIEGIKHMDKKALALYKKNPKKARQLITSYCKTQANQVVKSWWDFAWTLVARYDDGYINAPGKMAQEVGYPKNWYKKSEWPNGPTAYENNKTKKIKK